MRRKQKTVAFCAILDAIGAPALGVLILLRLLSDERPQFGALYLAYSWLVTGPPSAALGAGGGWLLLELRQHIGPAYLFPIAGLLGLACGAVIVRGMVTVLSLIFLREIPTGLLSRPDSFLVSGAITGAIFGALNALLVWCSSASNSRQGRTPIR